MAPLNPKLPRPPVIEVQRWDAPRTSRPWVDQHRLATWRQPLQSNGRVRWLPRRG